MNTNVFKWVLVTVCKHCKWTTNRICWNVFSLFPHIAELFYKTLSDNTSFWRSVAFFVSLGTRIMQIFSCCVCWWLLRYFLLLCLPSPGQDLRGIFSLYAYLKLSSVFSVGERSLFLTACVSIVVPSTWSTVVCGLMWSESTNLKKRVTCQLWELVHRCEVLHEHLNRSWAKEEASVGSFYSTMSFSL